MLIGVTIILEVVMAETVHYVILADYEDVSLVSDYQTQFRIHKIVLNSCRAIFISSTTIKFNIL